METKSVDAGQRQRRSRSRRRCAARSGSRTSPSPIPGAEKPALTDLSFTVEAGETLAVVGRNGAGKTTLFKLIVRLYDPNEGRILIDGIDIRDLDPVELREQVGAMFQDYVTYQATASENIGLGDVPDIGDREAIEKASKQAGADELISNLPDGLRHGAGQVVRRRGQPVGRRVAEGGAGPRVHARRQDPAAGRADLRARCAGGVRPVRAAALADPGPHRRLHLAPLLDREACRPHRVPGARQAGRGGHARGADAPERPLRAPVQDAGLGLHGRGDPPEARSKTV